MILRHLILVTVLFVSTSCHAGTLSKLGDVIEVESYRCIVKGQRSIECTNVGRVCDQDRARQKAQDDRYFGCATDAWKAEHPGESCLPFAQTYFAPAECMTLRMGGY